MGAGEQLEGGDGSDGWVPHGGERRGKEGGSLLGLGPREGRGRHGPRGAGPGRNEREGEGIPFYFSNKFSNPFSISILNQSFFAQIHISQNKMLQHVCINIFLNLNKILISKVYYFSIFQCS
jgi:hypothetical protein